MERDGRNIDNLAGLARDHLRKNRLRGVEHTFHVHILHLVPLLSCHGQKRLAWKNSGVVDENVDRTKLVLRALEGAANGGAITDVHGESERAGAAGAYLLRGCPV